MKTWCYALVLLFLLGSSKDNADGWIDSISGGNNFMMANTTRLYYVDENNKGLIDPDKIETLPFTYRDGVKPTVIQVPDDFDRKEAWLYNGNSNGIIFDADENMYYASTYLQGNYSMPNYTFYLSCDGVLDQFDVKWSYKPGAAVGGNGVAARMNELKINGVKVANDDDLQTRKIFIKRKNGKTVSVTSR